MKQQLDKQRIFITGGAGFIGANLVQYLLNKGAYEITVYDNLSAGSKANLDKAIANSNQNGEVRFIQADILDFDTLIRAMTGHNVVIHLAAHTRVLESVADPKENFKVNTKGTFNLLEAVHKNKIEKFVFASSNAAVGEQKPPINEEMVPKPLSPYGATKLYGEALCSAYYHSYGLKTVALRFANAYGPYSDHKTSVIAKFLRRVRQGKALEIYGDGQQTRDFIHAQDIAQAIDLVITHDSSRPVPWGEVFQIATGRETKIIDLAMIIKKSGSYENLSSIQIVFRNSRKGEIRKNHSDTKKAREVLAFKPRISLENGIKKLFEVD